MPIGEATHPGARKAANNASGVYEGARCRDCLNYPDPGATHAVCSVTGKRKAGYAAACRKNGRGRSRFTPRPVVATPPIPRHCTTLGCTGDMSGEGAKASYCPECRAAIQRMTVRCYRTPKPAACVPQKEDDMDNAGVWTMGDEAVLREHGHEGKRAVAALLGRTEGACVNRASLLGISLAKRDLDAATEPPAGFGSLANDEPRESTYACWNRAMVPSCPLRAEDGDCGVLDELPHTIAECKAAAMPITEPSSDTDICRTCIRDCHGTTEYPKTRCNDYEPEPVDTSAPTATCDDAPTISEVSTEAAPDTGAGVTDLLAQMLAGAMTESRERKKTIVGLLQELVAARRLLLLRNVVGTASEDLLDTLLATAERLGAAKAAR